MNEKIRALYLAEQNVDTIIDCLCGQIQSLQAMNDMYRSSVKRLEENILALKMKYEPMTDEEEADILG